MIDLVSVKIALTEMASMRADAIFQYANMLALLGWAVLVVSPWFKRFADVVAALIIPALLAVAYCGLVLAFWSGGRGGFGSLDAVSQLFQSRELLLAGWLHYLAFDLFVGAWEVRTARSERLAFVFVLPFISQGAARATAH